MAKEASNVKALVEFRLKDLRTGKSRKVQAGEVVAKDDFASKGEWQNLAHMRPARVEETDDEVGKPKAAETDESKAPKKATRDNKLPGAQ